MLRKQFVNPLFKVLGWDIKNEVGNAEAYKDVIYEASIKIGGSTKAPDYCFRSSETPKFFLEAKKPVVRQAWLVPRVGKARDHALAALVRGPEAG